MDRLLSNMCGAVSERLRDLEDAELIALLDSARAELRRRAVEADEEKRRLDDERQRAQERAATIEAALGEPVATPQDAPVRKRIPLMEALRQTGLVPAHPEDELVKPANRKPSGAKPRRPRKGKK